MASCVSPRDGFGLLKASGRGSLINAASIMGHRGLRQLAAYSATLRVLFDALTARARGGICALRHSREFRSRRTSSRRRSQSAF